MARSHLPLGRGPARIGHLGLIAADHEHGGMKRIGGEARIEGEGGEVLASRAEPRPAFFGRAGLRRNLRWDALDSTYFAGYAMWTYLSEPISLTFPGVVTEEIGDWNEDGQTWHRLGVHYPPSIATHNADQVLYVDADGLWQQTGIIRFWRVADGVMRQQFDARTGIGVTSPIAWSPDATQFAYGTYEGTAVVARTPAQ